MTCPGCGLAQECALIQSINAARDGATKRRLLAGQLNVLACACGKQIQLAATLVFHDPDANWFGQVVLGGEPEMASAARTMRAAASGGTLRLVPSQNALIEKVKLLDAALDDWAIEMAKVLLLASLAERDLSSVLLFDRVDREARVIHWVLFGGDGRDPRPMASPLAAYAKLSARSHGAPTADELRIDRAWAIEAVRVMIACAN